ncbi:hypothetical protein L484_021296 [Morus notabilis]|uniref:Cyclin-dependent protein kinase inhibitor SMR3 n=2 Tax=Morus notabilis TaxID=981085 RepID=W9S875_9ROSA|nr:hypothetical protein L484_021296 [Morus notabilis]
MSNSDLLYVQDDHDDDDDQNVPLSFLHECRASPSDREDDNSDFRHDQEFDVDQDDHDQVYGQREEQDSDDDGQQETMNKDQAKIKKEEKEEVLVLITDHGEESTRKTASSSLRESDVKVEDDEDDGFKTPTSLDHKIPVIQQCPSAPRKPKVSFKRKAAPPSSRTARRSLQLNFSEQIESMFPDLQCLHKSKKARRADHQAE